MPTAVKDCLDITESLLVKLAGIRAYERGADYFDEGRVQGLIINDNQISAEVAASKSYQVTLIYNQHGLSGSCDCPASEGIYFCKHCVATALALKTQMKEKPLQKSTGQEKMLITWLEQQSKAEIIKHFVTVVMKDRHLRQEWLSRAGKGLGRIDKNTLKKQITAALPLNKHIYEYQKVRTYFAGVTIVMQEIELPIRNLAAPERLELIDYIFKRMDKVLETVDDSGGFRYDALNIMKELHQDTVKDLEWSDKEIATYLLDLSLTNDYYFYGKIPCDYANSISPSCLEQFYDKVQKRWNALPRLTSENWKAKEPYLKLETFLSYRAENNNDKQALIAIKEKIAVSANDYLRLGEIYLELENYDETQSCLDKARLSSQYDRHHERDLQFKLWQRTGQWDKAVQNQWCYFQQQYCFKDYQRLLELADQGSDKKDWTTEVINVLQKQLEKDKKGTADTKGTDKKTDKDTCSDSVHNSKPDTLTMIYLQQQDLEQAWLVSRSWTLSDEQQLALAVALTDDSSEENWARGLQLYKPVIDSLVSKTQNDAYQKAISLLKPLADKATTSSRKMGWCRMLVTLRETHKRKRNFIVLLTESFPLKAI